MLQTLQMFQTVGLSLLMGLTLVLVILVMCKEKVDARRYWGWRINTEGAMFCLGFLLLFASAAIATSAIGAVVLNLSATILLPLSMLHEMRRLAARSKTAQLVPAPLRRSAYR
jgi:drug/metabolite transporter (DMT)-like permease